MIGKFKRYNMKIKPNRQAVYLLPIVWGLSFLGCFKHKAKIRKTSMDEVRPPYLLLCNHNAFLDFKVMTKAIYPNRANYVVAIDGFIGREWLMRLVGCICTRKFTNDLTLVKNMLAAAKHGDVVVLFPEARYSLCGTDAVLPESLGKMIKLMNIPVVTLIMNGHHINQPFWNLKERKVKHVEAELKLLYTVDQIKKLSVSQINEELATAFEYDDYKWQKDNQIKVKYPHRARGLHKVLYQCAHCQTEYEMQSEKDMLWCNHCKKQWHMNELGELIALEGNSEFTHIPDWYEWQRMNVIDEINLGAYQLESKVKIRSLPNSKGFIELEDGILRHDLNGFYLKGSHKGESYELKWPAQAIYSCHIEYDYKNFGDSIDLSMKDESLYLSPYGGKFSVTKIALATEELYQWKKLMQDEILEKEA